MKATRACSVDGCARPYRAKGFCGSHLARFTRHGDPLAGRISRGERAATCAIDGCERPHLARGLCSTHWQRDYKHGDVRHERSMPTRERHHRWSGDTATYHAVHQRLRYQRGAASAHPCVSCGEQAAHWAYDHNDPSELVCPDLKCRYSTDLERYQPMCVPCHKAFDQGAE